MHAMVSVKTKFTLSIVFHQLIVALQWIPYTKIQTTIPPEQLSNEDWSNYPREKSRSDSKGVMKDYKIVHNFPNGLIKLIRNQNKTIDFWELSWTLEFWGKVFLCSLGRLKNDQLQCHRNTFNSDTCLKNLISLFKYNKWHKPVDFN